MGIYRRLYINSLLKRGRGFAATMLFRDILLEIKLKQKEKPLRIFNVAVKRIPPLFFYKKLTLGGLKHNVPVSIHKKREILISATWVIALAKKREIKNFKNEVATILIDAAYNGGAAIEKRAQWHAVGLENRIFVRFLR